LERELDSDNYRARRAWLEEYFDRTAAAAWAELTSETPVGPVRARVRAGRDRMRAIIAGWLPSDLHGCRVLDAGCGTGPISVELARRGARVVAVDLAARLIDVARGRAPRELAESIDFVVGDMLDPTLGAFDYAVAMDSLIHYAAHDAVAALTALAPRIRRSLFFTFVPRTRLFAVARILARVLPRVNGPPSVEPVAETRLRSLLASEAGLSTWRPARTAHVNSGFYRSQALELLKAPAAPR
jgi:magnesium-protoporphyrin O-methyltransferase